jgi:CheY-like chemotaxis protein
MNNKINTILLIDDDQATNFLHKMVIKKADCAEKVHIELNGEAAINYLHSINEGKHPSPDLIFLDINMPRMNGWSFLEEYQKLQDQLKGKAVIVMLTTSLNPDDMEESKKYSEISEFRSKPMTQAMLEDIIAKYFPAELAG